MVPVGLIMAYAFWRFIRGIGKSEPITPEDESNALALTIAEHDLHLP
jgi:hypothetical protein